MSSTTSTATRRLGFASIDEDDFDRMKWYGVYRQKPKDSGYFMMRLQIPGGQITGGQADPAHGACGPLRARLLRHHDAA